jgi:hypothetical protein
VKIKAHGRACVLPSPSGVRAARIRRAERAVIKAAVNWSKIKVNAWGGTGVPGIISDGVLAGAVERLLKAREK